MTENHLPRWQSFLPLVAIVLVCVMLSAAFVIAFDIFFLVFLASLFAVFLNKMAGFVERASGVSHFWSVCTILVLLTAIFIGFLYLFGTRIEDQVSGAINQMEKASETVTAELDERPSVAWLLGIRKFDQSESSEQTNTKNDNRQKPKEPSDRAGMSSTADDRVPESSNAPKDGAADQNKSRGDGLERVAKVAVDGLKKMGSNDTTQHIGSVLLGTSTFFRTTFGWLGNLAFVLLVGIFIAFEPKLYRAGMIRIFPKQNRELASQMLDELYDTSWNWMVGRMATMILTGAGTGLVLWIIGVPMAMLLGVVTAILTFFPNFGSVAALFLAVAFAAPMGSKIVVIVIVSYLVFQFLESNILTPMIQKHQAAIPPAVLLSTQLLMGGVFGFMGVLVAEPTAALGLHLTKRLYVQRELEGLNVPKVDAPQHD